MFLDISLIIPTYQKAGLAPTVLLGASLIGSMVISFYLLSIGEVRWGKNEKISLSLVIITFLLWVLSEYGERPIISNKDWVIFFGVISQVIAGWPLTKESYRRPRPIYIPGYLLFILGCILSLVLEKSIFKKVTIENHLFFILLGIQTIVDIIPLIKKWWKDNSFVYMLALSIRFIGNNKKRSLI